MKKSLLLGLGVLLSLPLAGQSVADAVVTLGAPDVTATHVKSLRKAKAAPGMQVRPLRNLDNRIPAAASIRAPHQFVRRAAGAAGELPAGCSLYESFEGWDGQDIMWLPDGWTHESHNESALENAQRWSMADASSMSMLGFGPADGQYALGINYSDELPQDEWVISPEIEISENQQLSFFAYIDPAFLFDLNYADWDNMVLTEKHISATLKVMVQPEGGEWTEIWDASTPFMETELEDLLMMTPMGLDEYILPLPQFAGKKVKIAFNYVGVGGNTMFLDMVSVAMPKLDKLHYSSPLHTLYWGYDRTPGWASLSMGVAQYPVFTPIEWTNESPYTEATYQWTYCDPLTADWVDSNDEVLSVTYVPDYTSETTTKNNLFYPPILKGSMPGASEGQYQAPYAYFQAGGAAEISLSDGEWNGGLLPFEPKSEGLTYLTQEADFGELETPITGYNKNTDKFWYDYTFPGETDPSYHSYVEGCLNYIYTADMPLVVSGATVLARGKVADEVEMTLTIYPINDSYEPLLDQPLATATLKGKDFLKYDVGMALDFLTLPFDFETPVVIDKTYQAYIVMLTGYHNELVEYFAPMQSEYPNPESLCFGYVSRLTKWNSDEYRRGFTPLAYLDGEYGPCYNAFAINLVGNYGWLRTEVEKVTLPEDGTPVTVALDSYYDGEDLTVSELDGVVANVAGRYGNTVLTLSRDVQHAQAIDGTLTVSTPGHSVSINVVSGGSGITEITTAGAEVEGVYSVAGVRLDADAVLEPGIYVVRYTDGTVKKMQVR